MRTSLFCQCFFFPPQWQPSKVSGGKTHCVGMVFTTVLLKNKNKEVSGRGEPALKLHQRISTSIERSQAWPEGCWPAGPGQSPWPESGGRRINSRGNGGKSDIKKAQEDQRGGGGAMKEKQKKEQIRQEILYRRVSRDGTHTASSHLGASSPLL